MDKTAEQIAMDRIVREVTESFKRDLAEIMARHAPQKPHGCICPPTSEQTCKGQFCPRKPLAISF